MRLSEIEQIIMDTNDVYSHKHHTLTAMHFINYEGLCQIIRTIFNMHISLSYC